jgi:hypothetical protein
MAKAAIGCTKPAAGVIATKPATAPEIPPSTLGSPLRVHSAPAHNMQAPMKRSTTLCGAVCSFGYPTRLPRYRAHTKAETPEVRCTTVPPAKSSVGKRPPSDAFRRPPLTHTICAIGS